MNLRCASMLAAGLILGACAPFPAVKTPTGDPGAYPSLQPIDALLAEADAPHAGDPGPALAARAARLKARAAALGRP